MTYVDDILLTGNYEEEVQGMVNHLPKRHKEQDLGVPDKLPVVALMVTTRAPNSTESRTPIASSVKGCVISMC